MTDALWFVAKGRVELRPETLRPTRDGEVVVRARASAISQGTELLLYRGEGPEPFDPSLGDAAGAPTFPRRYGYAWVGVDEATGRRVFALAPHGTAHVLAASSLRGLPDDVPDVRATLAANLETAVTCAWDAAPVLGEEVAVFGAGVVGLLVAWILAKTTSVTIVEPSPARRAAAARLVPSARVVERAASGGVDLAIEASGRPEVLDAAIAVTRPEGRIVLASFYGRRRAAVDLGDAFHRRRLRLVASQVSAVPPALRGAWTVERRWALVVALLRELDAMDPLIATVPFDDAPEVYARLASAEDLTPCHVFVYR